MFVWFFGYAAIVLFSIYRTDGDTGAAVIIIPLLTLAILPIARHFARVDRDPAVFAIIMAGFVLKFVGATARYLFAFAISGGFADAQDYHVAGRKIAPFLRSLDFSFHYEGTIPGTGFLRVFTGGVYAIFGASRFAGFFVFAFLSYLGILLFWRAFKIGLPEGNSKRYLILLIFLPSMVFWPSGINKEAFMMLVLGACAYGTACLLRGNRGALLLIPGLIGATLLRPHVSLLVYCGVLFAFFVRKAPARNAATPALRIFAVGVLLIGGLVLVSQASTFLGVKSLTQESIEAKLSDTAASTGADSGASSGSAFTAVQITSPVDIPFATVTVLFRPFPYEAGSLQSLIAAVEGFVLLVLFVFSWSRIRTTRRLIRRRPYIAYAIGFVAAFIFAFSSFSNFGLLARERTQMLPLLLVLFALPTARELAAARTVEVSA